MSTAEPHPLLIVVSGPSGVGKDAVLTRVRELRPEVFWAITATTRAKRAGEEHGVHHLFHAREEFLDLLERGELLEHAEVYGNLYGVPKAPVREALSEGRDAIVRTDVQGAASIRSIAPGCAAHLHRSAVAGGARTPAAQPRYRIGGGDGVARRDVPPGDARCCVVRHRHRQRDRRVGERCAGNHLRHRTGAAARPSTGRTLVAKHLHGLRLMPVRGELVEPRPKSRAALCYPCAHPARGRC